ncbi:microtubule-actin cross-linking factor 1, isoforms 6/7, partial [Heptranchias perlo]|uniref:microtubule-actin cross-linking factor 1, isoforms 6/7 n=1 Tax=Heptranchias perlo TaxID=212740 RepID=UPI003559C77C
ELCKQLESKQCTYDNIHKMMEQLLTDSDIPKGSSTEHSLDLLEQKWEAVYLKVQERKGKLSDGVTLETRFHGNAQELMGWMAETMNSVNNLPAASLILDTVNQQLQEHQVITSDVTSHGAQISELEHSSETLKYYSRKQDSALIHNLMVTVLERWGKLSCRTAERGRTLEEARKQARQFSESRKMMLDWIDQMDKRLETLKETAVNGSDIKEQLSGQKDLQKALRGKRAVYEATLRNGRLLLDRAQRAGDREQLEELVTELRDHWDTLSGKCVERQHKLEEALLFSGRFTDALQALLDWLYEAELQLGEELVVNGDRELVNSLINKHKIFQKELGKRASCVKALKRALKDLTKNRCLDSLWLQAQMEELSREWEEVCGLSVSKQDRLEAALKQAEEFHSLVQSFLGHLTEAERRLKNGNIPEKEEELKTFHQRHKEQMKSLDCERLELDCIVSMGDEILLSCHPESVVTLQSWIRVVQHRWEEVMSWASQQDARIQDSLQIQASVREETERLLDWVSAAEESLTLRDQDPLPDEIVQIMELISQHTVFLDELMRKKPEMEKETKSCSQKLGNQRHLAHRLRGPTRKSSSVRSQPPLPEPPGSSDTLNPRTSQLLGKWHQLWLLALDRQCRLQDRLGRLRELEAFESFDFNTWRKRYMQWISHKKSRVLDVFRCIDKDQDGRISQQEFIESVLTSKFPTNSLEMAAVASVFDLNGDGFIDYYEFTSALHPRRDSLRRRADGDRIEDEVCRQVAQCNCVQRFQVEQISANRYRFGDSQKLRMVRILRCTVMVRVGGGWSALDEFLVKNDPCRVKGRTNLKIKEKYLGPDSFGIRLVNSAEPRSQEGSPSRWTSSVTSYSCVSAPNSPLPRKSVIRRSRSGDRSCSRPQSRSSILSEDIEFRFCESASAPEMVEELHMENQ